MRNITLIEKIIAVIKGELLNKTLETKEYYYLTFGCETEDDITLIKSTTLEEAKYFLDCCWYLGIERACVYQLGFMKRYRKFKHLRESA